jgi:SAM-dependent methyltransferase
MRRVLGKIKRRILRRDEPWDPNLLLDLHTLSDKRFVEVCHRFFLDRKSDETGLEQYLADMNQGASRLEILRRILCTEEYINRAELGFFGSCEAERALPDLFAQYPDHYQVAPLLENSNDTALFFKVMSLDDFDWLEHNIFRYGYYDHPHSWGLCADDDKRRITQIALSMNPSRSLELGCATGQILNLMRQAGVDAEGVDISHLALSKAWPSVRRFIHFGDLLELNLDEGGYDLVLGLDIFEHLNPNKLPEYVERCFRILAPGGFLLANIPAYGKDRIFGEVHKCMTPKWLDDLAKQKPFDLLHADTMGWPVNGHLCWAGTEWWEEVFTSKGFTRAESAEKKVRATHAKDMARETPARLSFYIFKK